MAEEMQNMDQGEVNDSDRLWSLLSYIFSPLVPILALVLEGQKNRSFVRYHAFHALILGILAYVLSFTCVGWLLVFGYSIYLGIQAYQGKMPVVPVLTDLIKNQGWV